jgi:uncharacterized LabA/DUF88 family protein
MIDRSFLAIYIDLENVNGQLNIQRLMQDIIIQHETGDGATEAVFAVKMACGNSSSISKLRGQLKEQNFEIREIPHVSRKKNRADLAISISAFERLYLGNPSIDKFVFVTNDSDFTAIMDVLRKYGKEVWLVAQEQESKKEIFNSCSDNILIVEDYLEKPREVKADRERKQREVAVKSESRRPDPDSSAVALLKNVLQSLNADKVHYNSQLGMKFHQIQKSFNLKKTKFRSFNNLVNHFVEQGILEKTTTDKKDVQVRIVNVRKLEEI